MRQICFDVETTGLDPAQGHRVIEIGCVELVNRHRTGEQFHAYLNPQRRIDAEAIEVHGLTQQFLADKPTFAHVAPSLLDFLDHADALIAHNAAFDVGFVNRELAAAGVSLDLGDAYTVIDTLKLARTRFPGKRNSLDALCARLGVDNTLRTQHGALLDAELLADVYLKLTGGQSELFDPASTAPTPPLATSRPPARAPSLGPLRVIRPSADELRRHRERLHSIDAQADDGALWLKIDDEDSDSV